MGSLEMTEQFSDFDIATLLRSDAAIADFLTDALEDDDAALFAHALGIAARAKGMTKVSNDTGLAREALYRSFSEEGNPSLKSTIAVLKSLGFGLSIRRLDESDAAAGKSEAAE
jgi:probable addiction module antidote protein